MNHARLPALVLAAGLVLAACGDDSTTGTAAATTAAPTTAGGPVVGGQGYDYGPPADDGDSGAATVSVATDGELGDHLVDGDGRTLYLFEKDQGTTTACTGGCPDNWPPLVTAGPPIAADGIDATALSTSPDGIEPGQVTYHDHLLYLFAGDTQPGDTNGIGIPSWYAVAPSGDAIDSD